MPTTGKPIWTHEAERFLARLRGDLPMATPWGPISRGELIVGIRRLRHACRQRARELVENSEIMRRIGFEKVARLDLEDAEVELKIPREVLSVRAIRAAEGK